jgi:PKD repeat protein
VTLTVTDDKGAVSDPLTKNVTVTAPPANVKPTAAFTSTVSNLTAAFDGSGSTDSDGTVASYAWTFGDNTTGTGAKPSHTYTTAGTYAVKLTVTDNRGAVSDPITKNVTVTAPANNVLANDLFQRTVNGGWGTAPTGGAWTVGGAPSRASVAAGTGKFSLPAALTMTANLNAVQSQTSRVTAEFSVDKLYAGSSEGAYVALVGRQVGSDQYVGRIVIQPSGAVRLYLLRNWDALAAMYTVPGLTIVPGQKYKLSVLATGVGPTTVAAKVWKSTNAEPTAWQRSATDTYAPLQKPGSIGTFVYLPGTTTNAPITASFFSFQATRS